MCVCVCVCVCAQERVRNIGGLQGAGGQGSLVGAKGPEQVDVQRIEIKGRIMVLERR